MGRRNDVVEALARGTRNKYGDRVESGGVARTLIDVRSEDGRPLLWNVTAFSRSGAGALLRFEVGAGLTAFEFTSAGLAAGLTTFQLAATALRVHSPASAAVTSPTLVIVTCAPVTWPPLTEAQAAVLATLARVGART